MTSSTPILSADQRRALITGSTSEKRAIFSAVPQDQLRAYLAANPFTPEEEAAWKRQSVAEDADRAARMRAVADAQAARADQQQVLDVVGTVAGAATVIAGAVAPGPAVALLPMAITAASSAAG
ncbi:hypothetical protein EAH80_04825 [Mycobacterium hodleri]|uniref:Uncharacterized protein n=2 Tax=Mycolicibacterium hodleri TaxID=49897 RepID=A0A502EJ60_9MYCO|nr:hypothetical protein EAH80_04825 [Mycolicibacterium hodleri]